MVEAFNRSENSIMDILSDAIITRGILLLFPSSALAQRMMGNRGSTQGASTVRTPDKNAVTRSIIVLRKEINIGII